MPWNKLNCYRLTYHHFVHFRLICLGQPSFVCEAKDGYSSCVMQYSGRIAQCPHGLQPGATVSEKARRNNVLLCVPGWFQAQNAAPSSSSASRVWGCRCASLHQASQ